MKFLRQRSCTTIARWASKTWAEMPASRRVGVKKVLAERVNKGEITAEDYKRITGDDYDVA